MARSARAQQRNDNTPNPSSNLALQNLKQVAGSAPEIKAVLTKDPGLLVELKRWVAKDATDHGQIVGESELSDYAIFDRLGTDVEFRSVATALLQKYGYLLPKLNPESDQAKEQELLRIERTKWMAQAEEEQRGQARQKETQDLQKTAACESEPTVACNQSQPAQPPQLENPGQGRQIDTSPYRMAPPDQTIPNLPGGTGDILQRAQLMQTGGGSGSLDTFPQGSQVSQAGNLGAASFSNTSTGTLSSDTGDASTNRQLVAAFSGATPGAGSSSDGLLAAFGTGMGTGMGIGIGTGMGTGMEAGIGTGADPSRALLGMGGQTSGLSPQGSG